MYWCAPPKGLHIGTKGRAAPASSRFRRPVDPVERATRNIALGGNAVTYVDRTLSCVDCSQEFIHSADDQTYYAEKGFSSEPKRCVSCRASRRAARDGGGYDAHDLGGPRGYETGGGREFFAVLCSECGNQAQVPFRPRMDRPVYCSDCFRKVRPD